MTNITKAIKSLLFFTFCTTNVLLGQKISNIDFDLIKSHTQDSTSSFYYPLLIQRFLQFDTTLTEKEFCFIYYGNVFKDNYNPYGTGEDEEKFIQLFRQKNIQEAIPFGQKALIDNPVNLNILYKMLICFHNMGDKTTARKYANLYYGLLEEIYKSGDGRKIESAYVVIKVSDEYQILNDLELESTGQALLKGETDRLTINTKGQKKVKGRKKISELYFNVSKPFEHMSKQFKMSE